MSRNLSISGDETGTDDCAAEGRREANIRNMAGLQRDACCSCVSAALVGNIKSLLQEEKKKTGFEKDVGLL